jgi:DNA-binding response OmpR family regulator
MSNLPVAGERTTSLRPEPAASATLSAGNIELDLSTYRVSVGPRQANLSYQEFELLRFLAGSPDRVASFAVLCDFLWGSQGRRENRRLNVLVCRLRGKLTGSSPYGLETVRGRGYGLLSQRVGSEPAQGRKGGPS